MNNDSLKEKDYIINFIADSYNEEDIKSIGRKLEIRESAYFATGISLKGLSSKLVDEVYRHTKKDELIDLICYDKELKRKRFLLNENNIPMSPLGNKTANIFGNFFTKLLNKLNEIDIDDDNDDEPQEIDLVDPIDFEGKMKNKAKFSEGIINTAIFIKPEISYLQRKAKCLNYRDYQKLIFKLANYYHNVVCKQYPADRYPADERYRRLYDSIIEMLPEECIYDDEIDIKINGVIFDTLSKCLIFNN